MIWAWQSCVAAAALKASVVLPYYDYHEFALSLFTPFLNSTDAAMIDCFRFPTECAAYDFTPGCVHVLMPTGRYRRIERRMNPESLRQLFADVAADNWREFGSLDDIERFANESRVFALVARPNAGDLEEKRAAVQAVARASIFADAAFGIISEPGLYERFGRYPLTTFVFVERDLSFDSFRGDFEFDRLVEFVKGHDRGLAKGIRVVRVGGVRPEDPKVGWVDPEKEMALARAIGWKAGQYEAIVDFERYRVVPVDGRTWEEAMGQFERVWKGFGIGRQMGIAAQLSFVLHRDLCFAAAVGVGLMCVVVALYAIDLGNEVPDARRVEKKGM
jgi:hypothetical protein